MTKKDQLKWNKTKPFKHKEYFKYLHNSNQSCIICGNNHIEIHHVTDLKNIQGKRRDHKRVITLCPTHHRLGSFAIHVMSKEDFYNNVMDLDTLLFHSNRLLQEYEELRIY